MATLLCEECGRPIKANEQRCSYCGFPLHLAHCSKPSAVNNEPVIDSSSHTPQSASTSKPNLEGLSKKEKSLYNSIPLPTKPKFFKHFLGWFLSLEVVSLIMFAICGILDIIILLCTTGFWAIFSLLMGLFSFKRTKKSYEFAQANPHAYRINVILRKRAEEEAQKIREQAKKTELEREYRVAVASQSAKEPWAVRYSTSPCPKCGHYKVRTAKWDDKRMSVAFWGAASSTIGKGYICDHCKKMW